MQIHFIVIIHKSIDGGKMKFYAVFLANIKHIIQNIYRNKNGAGLYSLGAEKETKNELY